MASIYKTKQKKQFWTAIICCALVFIMLASTIVISISHKMSFYQDFSDKNFASAIATALGLSSQYDLTQEDLDRFEGLIYFCSVGVDTTTYQSYATPVVMLCDKTYTDALMEQTDPDYEGESEENVDYSKNIVQVGYILTDPADLNLFRNLRMLRAYDVSELSTMSEGCYQTQLYSMYGLGNIPYTLDTIVEATKLSALTDLSQISSLTKLEQLSLCYTGITSLNGIENFPNLNKLDVANTALTDISALEKVPGLTYLSMNSLNVEIPEEDEDHDHDHDHETSGDTSADTSADTSSDASSDTSSEEEKEETPEEEEEREESKETEVEYNTTGLTNEDLTVLSKLPNLKYLDISNNNVTSLSALSSLKNIKYLSIATNPVESLAGVEGLTEMKLLHALDCSLTDISAVKGFSKLESVYLSGNSITDISALSSATEVTYLDASDNKITDMSAVTGMTKLITLALSDNNITAIPDLKGLDRLGSLDLSDNALEDASGLASFNPTYPGMSDDDIEADKKVEKEDDKAANKNTVTINLSDNYIKNITLSAKKLSSLDLSDNKLTAGEEGALKFNDCAKLETLTLTDNKTLTSLKGIESLLSLKTLTANKTGLTEIPDLKALKNLTTVNLSDTDLESLSGLKGNESVTTLTMTDCEKLKDIKDLVTLKKLTTVNFTDCTALDDTSIKDAFGTPKNGDKKAELIFDAKSKLNITLKGCKKITDFSIFSEYGNMKATYDKVSDK